MASGNQPFDERRRLARVDGYLWGFTVATGAMIVVGDLVSAIKSAAPFAHGSWLAAYLVLVGGVAQLVLGAGCLLPEPSFGLGRGRAQLILWNVGNACVVGGVLASAVGLVLAGSLSLLGALIGFAFGAGPTSSGSSRWLMLNQIRGEPRSAHPQRVSFESRGWEPARRWGYAGVTTQRNILRRGRPQSPSASLLARSRPRRQEKSQCLIDGPRRAATTLGRPHPDPELGDQVVHLAGRDPVHRGAPMTTPSRASSLRFAGLQESSGRAPPMASGGSPCGGCSWPRSPLAAPIWRSIPASMISVTIIATLSRRKSECSSISALATTPALVIPWLSAIAVLPFGSPTCRSTDDLGLEVAGTPFRPLRGGYTTSGDVTCGAMSRNSLAASVDPQSPLALQLTFTPREAGMRATGPHWGRRSIDASVRAPTTGRSAATTGGSAPKT